MSVPNFSALKSLYTQQKAFSLGYKFPYYTQKSWQSTGKLSPFHTLYAEG